MRETRVKQKKVKNSKAKAETQKTKKTQLSFNGAQKEQKSERKKN